VGNLVDWKLVIWRMKMQLNIELVANVRLDYSPGIRGVNLAKCI
jgi:hypothetical protein